MSEFEHPIAIRFSDFDPYGHVNHSVYLAYFETGRTSVCEELGYNLTAISADGISLVVAQLSVRYIHPIKREDRVVVRSRVLSAGRASIKWAQQLCNEDGVECATATIKTAAVDELGATTRMPQWLFEQLRKVSG